MLEARGGGLNDVHAGVPEAVLSAEGGEILGTPTVVRNDPGGTWRVTFDVQKSNEEKPLTMRCYLRRGEDALTETWIYRWDGGTP